MFTFHGSIGLELLTLVDWTFCKRVHLEHDLKIIEVVEKLQKILEILKCDTLRDQNDANDTKTIGHLGRTVNTYSVIGFNQVYVLILTNQIYCFQIRKVKGIAKVKHPLHAINKEG